ncbi:MAG: hypothetical protein Q7R45_04505 [Sulfuricaulis sp.]|nr:hypothetical protein [Sulfuricaulis sp.]
MLFYRNLQRLDVGLFDGRPAGTRRVAQPIATARYTNPRRIGIYVMRIAQA